ncbi:MAG: excinuclease ABC subunit UvrB [Bacteroidaceae bacterium]
MVFKLTSEFKPTGDQPEAIEQLTRGVQEGLPAQVLLGVTGSGKTFTMANVIQNIGRPTLILSHNKTLAHQLYEEMHRFFPENSVQYYVSYYDYYQPEAYIPSTNTYIEKDLAINEEIDRLRLAATSALLSGRKDVIVVSSVSCIYGMGSPTNFSENIIHIKRGENLDINVFLRKLVESQYVRNDVELSRGHFRVRGEIVDIYLAYDEKIIRVSFAWDTVDRIEELDGVTNYIIGTMEDYSIYPANLFMTSQETTQRAIHQIEEDLRERLEFYEEIGDLTKKNLLETRVTNDLEMIRELGHCSGIENYSRYFDGRKEGERPFCLLDFFPDDFLMIIDESHESIPQIRAMYGGDRKRKQTLVEYAYRLPAALDNRPLRFDEFEALTPQTIYVSATPATYELEKSEGVVAEQIIRPTGLLDPEIIIRPTANQVDDLMEEIQKRVERDERVLVTTLTKRMAEELSEYLLSYDVRCNYIHSDIDTFERVRILDELRRGEIDVLIGVNLLREGLDLPEVSLVAILDADKEGFLRSHRALTQTIGRAARNVNGTAILYADSITQSIQLTIDETTRRRMKQQQYNQEHGITPTQIVKTLSNLSSGTKPSYMKDAYIEDIGIQKASEDPIVRRMNKEEIEASITFNQTKMQEAAKNLDFVLAAQYRDEMIKLEDYLKSLSQ